LLQVIDTAQGVSIGGEHEIGHCLRGIFRISGVDGSCRDPQVNQLTLAVDRRGDEPAASGSLDLGLRQLLLRGHQLALHRRGRLEQLLHI
jgi:hypothetical protein